MKKKIALVTIRNEIKNMYYEELNSVFSDYLDIISYSLEVDHKYQTNNNCLKEADLILLTNPNIFTLIKDMVKEDCKILYLEFAFLKNKIEALRTLPQNTNALVCFNFHEVSNQAAATIYEMGITNLNLSVYDSELPILDKDYDIAIVGESSAVVPEKISTIVSLGRRKISFSTLIDLAVSANVLDDKLENRILAYTQELALPGSFVNNAYSNSLNLKSQLQTIMDCIDYAIIILNDNFKIINYNMNLKTMFNISDEIFNKQITEVDELNSISQHILNNQNIKNLLIEIKKNKNIIMSMQRIDKRFEHINSYIVLMKDVTEVIQIENTLKRQLEKKGYVTKHDFSHIHGNSREIKECIEKARIISKLDKDVLIIGESGTGKELFAQSIHNASPRKNYPFIGINCAALPSTLLESELFGYADGTFTGGKKGGKVGLFELANNGTLFLDEIGDMTLEIQAKILRVLEEKEFIKLGSGEVISLNVRIIAATNRDLKCLIKEGKFRLDLYYRLNTLMLKIPPLRKRKDDILFLINMFLEKEHNSFITIDKDVINFMVDYSWEGNVRELKNCIDYMVNISDGNIKMKHLPEYILDDFDNNECYIEKDIFYFLNNYEQKIVMSLLDRIANSGGGRRSIYKQLKQEYENLSEYKLRRFIKLLMENDLIQAETGRSGMKLTDAGRKFLLNEFF